MNQGTELAPFHIYRHPQETARDRTGEAAA